MFKVPDWEDDTNKVNLTFPKKAKTNNKRNKKLLDAPKLDGVIKPNLKAKNNLNENFKSVYKKPNVLKSNIAKPSRYNIANGNKRIIPNVKKHNPKRTKIEKNKKIEIKSNDSIGNVVDNKKEDKLYDTDKLDELILNEKKQKLNLYKNDDIEEILFNDNSENIKIKNLKLVTNESSIKKKETKKINQLQIDNRIVKTRENKKKGAPKSILQKRNRNNSENEKIREFHELENQIPKTKNKRKKVLAKSIIFQNGDKNNLENEKTNEFHDLENQIIKTKNKRKKVIAKSIILQNSDKNNMENEKRNELHQLENQILNTKDESKKKVQKSKLQNDNKNKFENKISKVIIPLSVGNKIVKIKDEKKKEAFKTILQSEGHRNSINVSGNKLRSRMLERLKAAQFRYLNEKLYTSSGTDAKQLFQEDPEAFQTYHEGYQQQVKRWPVKPLDVIVKRIQKMPKTHTIADMGCGEAELSTRVVQSVRSFDLVSSKPVVETCDMAHTPLLSSAMDVTVYCLALMGTDLTQYLIEANRVLKVGGHLLIAEVESRFHDVDSFTRDVQKLGFSLKKIDKSQKVFFFMEFTKVREPPVKKAKLPILSLKPCIYKKR